MIRTHKLPARRWCWTLAILPFIAAGEPPREPVFVGVVSGDKEYSIGAFDPVEGWTFVDIIPRAPSLGVPLTVYGLNGRLGVVQVTGILRHSDLSYWNSVQVSSWKPGAAIPDFDRPLGVVVTGDRPAPPRLPAPLPLDDPELRDMVARFLELQQVHVKVPSVRQALRIDLDGDGTEETLVCTEDFSMLADGRSGPVYSVALVQFVQNGQKKVVPFTAFARVKAVTESPADFQKRYGPAAKYRFLAFPDVEGKGRSAIFLVGRASYQTAAFVFTFDGATVERVLFGKVIL